MNIKDFITQATAFTAKVLSAVKAPAVFAGKMVNEHKGVRRGLVFWAMWLITHVTLRVFQQPALITSPEVAAYTVAVGILATVLGFYMQGRNKEDKPNVPPAPQ